MNVYLCELYVFTLYEYILMTILALNKTLLDTEINNFVVNVVLNGNTQAINGILFYELCLPTMIPVLYGYENLSFLTIFHSNMLFIPRDI